jgi:pimeloyl-ACP methyl ester carboxylesterase
MIRRTLIGMLPLLLLTACPSAPRPSDISTTPAGFTSDRIDVTTRGSGPDVILIPGLATHRDVWNGVAEQLDGRYRLHLVQVRGFAGVPAAANADGLVSAPVADEIARYVRELRLDRPAVIGHSMGGSIGMMVAARNPGLVGRLMVVDMPPFMGGMYVSANATSDSVRPIADQLRARVLAEDAGSPSSMLHGMFSGMTASDSMRAFLLRNIRESDPRTVANAFHELIVTDLREDIRRITVPMMLMYAMPKQVSVSNEQFEAAMRASFANAPHTRFLRIDESNHFIQIDQATRFISEVDAFMR